MATDFPPRLLPDADGIVLAVLRAMLPPTVQIGNLIPADLVDRLPYVVILRVGGTALDPRFADRALVNVQCWASSRQDSERLAQAVRDCLYLASRGGVTTDQGHISAFTEQAAPSHLDTGTEPSGVFRYQASYLLTTRN